MKKWIVGIIVLLVLSVLAVYIFIPNKIVVSQSASFATNRGGFYRNVMEQVNWAKWWPGDKKDSAQHIFRFNDFTYTVKDRQISSLVIDVKNDKLNYASSFTMIAPTTDSVTVSWENSIASSMNPLERISIYQQSKKLKADIDVLMDSLQHYFSDPSRMYGYPIQKASVLDSNLVFTSRNTRGYPDIPLIYSMVDELKAFIKKRNAKETAFPMLNVRPLDSTNFQVRVAIPVDRKLESAGDISYKWMLGGGNILITEVHGGTREINKAFQQVEYYVADNMRIAPAIPFLSLVTDRRAEPDSAKWVTRIYYPVM